ncbi:MAG: peptidyl-tRNA hydrolase, family [Actinomycetota bacterium]|nr:peptidyl-tRNA hydrolase, family [Actinomycetota bacterium]
MVWLVAGLGNPGERYAGTRHNIGASVVDALAAAENERFRKARFLPVETAEIRVGSERVILARSLRYMNDSGPAFAGLAVKFEIPPAALIAVHDELDIPFGTLRVKQGGGTSGHNGLKSLQAALRSPDFFRVRCGIGRPPGTQDPADFVLDRFTKREQSEVALLIVDAADGVTSLVVEGLAKTQDRFNGTGPAA